MFKQPDGQLENMISQEDAVSMAAIGEAIDRLMQNQDFVDVIMDEYQKKEPARLTSLLADPNAKEFQEETIQALKAISEFFYWLRTKSNLGKAAKRSLDKQEAKDKNAENQTNSYVD